MSSPPLARRMTSLDAAFLYTEQPTAPMHIGGIDILDGYLPLAEFAAMLSAKMPTIPRYRQRAVPAPFNLAHPTWETVRRFDVLDHVSETKVPAPGSEAQLRAMASRIFDGMLDRDKPLWKIVLVHGIEGDRTALVSLVHHCMVDGVSGVDLLNAVLDPSPTPRIPQSAPEPEPDGAPEPRLRDALWDTLTEQLESWADFQRDAAQLLRTFKAEEAWPMARELPRVLKDLLRPVRPMPFNARRFSGKRKLDWCSCSLAEIREIRKRTGGTMNDVALATLGGAVHGYLAHHGALRGHDVLRVMVPVSVRAEHQRGALGNRVSMLPVDVPLEGVGPAERIRAITQRTGSLKRLRTAEWLQAMMHLWEGAHPAVQALLGQAVFAPGLQSTVGAAILSPGLHMVCTNVPGPQIPLYALGRQVLAHVPLLPVAPGMGLNVGVFSYHQRMHFGFIADTAAVNDLARFRAAFERSFTELRRVAGVPEMEEVAIRPFARGSGTSKSNARKRTVSSKSAQSKIRVKRKPVAAKSKRGRTP
jgi:diacylglycerol O-acyltransferase / wax synthase